MGGLLLYFLGLSLRKALEKLSQPQIRNHVSIWIWIQKYTPRKNPTMRTKISELIVDKTGIKVGLDLIWLQVAIDPKSKEILALFYLINLRNETCLLLKDSLVVQSKLMKRTQFLQMMDLGIQWLVGSIDSNITTIPLISKALSKGRCGISGIEPKVLMTTFLVG